MTGISISLDSLFSFWTAHSPETQTKWEKMGYFITNISENQLYEDLLKIGEVVL